MSHAWQGLRKEVRLKVQAAVGGQHQQGRGWGAEGIEDLGGFVCRTS
jgi:hypothetical protein